VVKSAESMAIDVVRLLIVASQRTDVTRVTVTVHDEVASYLNNKKRRELARIEEEGQMTVQVLGKEGLFPEHLAIECRDSEGHVIDIPR
jgi:ribonuclease E